MRRLFKTAVVLLAAILAAGSWYVHRLRTGVGPREGDLTVVGINGPVEILRDSLGVPHVWAEDPEDLFFAQGFLHATDRLWQLELFRRLPGGQLSELLGAGALPADRFMRTVGLGAAAERSLEAIGDSDAVVMEAYAAGYNAAVGAWQGPLPPEFVLLRARPGRWTSVNTLAMEKIMAWDLAEYHTSLDLARARNALSEEFWELVRPGYPEWGTTILADAPAGEGDPAGAAGASASALLRAGDGPPRVSDGVLAAAELPPWAADLVSMASVVRASNSWVVGGDRSRSGKPLLANDMHLGLNQPNIWYLMGLHAPGLDVVGMTLPGAPGVVAGHSEAVAWGFTNAMVDDSDLFVERVDPSDSTRYLTPGGSEPFDVRTEVIRIRGGGADTIEVRETRHGPVVTPVEPRAGGDLLSFRWVAHEAGPALGAVLAMNRARSVGEFLEGLAGFANPHQNVVFADSAGDWGYWMAGRVPLRAHGSAATLPMPGWTGDHDWVGWLAFDQQPHALRPPAGYVATANNRQTRAPVSATITESWAPPFRAQRISELIEARPLHDAESMRTIQLDVQSAFVARHRADAVRAFRSAGLVREGAALEAWDGAAGLESSQATLFFAWIEEMRRGLRLRAYGEDRGYMPNRAVRRALEGNLGDLGALPSDAAVAAMEIAGGMRWGEAHQLTLGHALAGVPVVGRLMGFGKGPMPREGSPHSVNVAGYDGESFPYRVVAGPSQRHVVDMADPDGSGGFILPGGQSGLPDSRHSWDQLERWRRGELWLLPLSRDLAEVRTVSRFRLVPTAF